MAFDLSGNHRSFTKSGQTHPIRGDCSQFVFQLEPKKYEGEIIELLHPPHIRANACDRRSRLVGLETRALKTTNKTRVSIQAAGNHNKNDARVRESEGVVGDAVCANDASTRKTSDEDDVRSKAKRDSTAGAVVSSKKHAKTARPKNADEKSF